MTDVIFTTLACEHNNQQIGVVELNNPKALNALTLSMIRSIHNQLKKWELDQNIAVIFLKAAGEKAFCAGGDVVNLCKEIARVKEQGKVLDDEYIINSPCSDFFKEEYILDLYLHEYKKPILVWGNGYVFGGGLGLFAGASHRITTEQTIMAMPETAIGLYPEVGASWFLNQMPSNIGLFLGITGAFINATDAKFLGLSNFTVANEHQSHVLNQLCKIDWEINANDHQKLNKALHEFEIKSEDLMPSSVIKENEKQIAALVSANDIETIYQLISTTHFEQPWLQTAQEKLKKGSVLSILLTYKQLELTKTYSKAQCFKAELNLSLRCCQFTEFLEGVRAHLIDKDKAPNWSFNHIEDIDSQLVSWFFAEINKLNFK